MITIEVRTQKLEVENKKSKNIKSELKIRFLASDFLLLYSADL